MALQKTVTTPHGFDANDAYHRVENVSLLTKEKIRFSVRSYKSPQEPFFNEEYHECAYQLDGDNPIKQAYGYVKGLDAFENAADV